jgi:outer membrane biosynthesis protein TonB
MSVFGYAVSLLFHALVMAAALIAFRHTFDVAPESHAVPVDLVTVTEKTNIAPQAPPAPKPEKLVIPQEAIEPPALPQFEEAEPAPDVQAPKFKIRPETKHEQSRDLAALLNKLTAPQKAPPKNAKASTRTVTGIGAMNGMTADLADALKNQIYRCWSPPVGAPNANELVVDFDLQLNPDGSVIRADSSSTSPGNPNRYNYAAAMAAQRAIFLCAPYKLPADRYTQWREINPLRFDPRQMMGQ